MEQVAAVGPMTSSGHQNGAVLTRAAGSAGRALSSYDDDALMVRAQDGDKEAFAILIERHTDIVVAVATRFLADPDAGRDVAQDVFLELWLNRLKYAPEGRFKGYLTTLVLNRCRDATRRRGSEQRRRDGLAALGRPRTDDPSDAAMKDQSSQQLQSALGQLGDEDRQILVMRYGMELGYDDIARETGRPAGTLRSRVFHALRKMRGLLEGVS